VAGFQTRHVEQIAHEAIKTLPGFVNFSRERSTQPGIAAAGKLAQSAGGARDGRDGCAQLVLDRIEERVSEPLRFRDELGVLFGVTQALAVEHERDLADEAFKQVALVERKAPGILGLQTDDPTQPSGVTSGQ
jgi:hypothetical protein